VHLLHHAAASTAERYDHSPEEPKHSPAHMRGSLLKLGR
jgi:hypothetical protein